MADDPKIITPPIIPYMSERDASFTFSGFPWAVT